MIHPDDRSISKCNTCKYLRVANEIIAFDSASHIKPGPKAAYFLSAWSSDIQYLIKQSKSYIIPNL